VKEDVTHRSQRVDTCDRESVESWDVQDMQLPICGRTASAASQCSVSELMVNKSSTQTSQAASEDFFPVTAMSSSFSNLDCITRSSEKLDLVLEALLPIVMRMPSGLTVVVMDAGFKNKLQFNTLDGHRLLNCFIEDVGPKGLFENKAKFEILFEAFCAKSKSDRWDVAAISKLAQTLGSLAQLARMHQDTAQWLGTNEVRGGVITRSDDGITHLYQPSSDGPPGVTTVEPDK